MSIDPSWFVDLVKRGYRGRNQPKRQLDEKDAALARHSLWVLDQWHQLPCLDSDGTVDEARLTTWVRDVRLDLSESDRSDVGDQEIGRLLSTSPVGSDGIWPDEAVRNIIEAIGSPGIEAGVHRGRVNSRGVTNRGVYEGGKQERELANEYLVWVKKTAHRWPRTARLLKQLAEGYEIDARRMDERANVSADTE